MLELSNLSRETRLHANSLGPLGHSRLSSLNHRRLILVYKQEFVCVSWSSPEKKAQAGEWIVEHSSKILGNEEKATTIKSYRTLLLVGTCWHLVPFTPIQDWLSQQQNLQVQVLHLTWIRPHICSSVWRSMKGYVWTWLTLSCTAEMLQWWIGYSER